MTEQYIPRKDILPFDEVADAAGEGFGVAGETFQVTPQQQTEITSLFTPEQTGPNGRRYSGEQRHDFYDAVDMRSLAQMEGRE